MMNRLLVLTLLSTSFPTSACRAGGTDDRLPTGAILRIGTCQLRRSPFPGRSAVSNDGKILVYAAGRSRLNVWIPQDTDDLRRVHTVDLMSGKAGPMIETANQEVDELTLSPTGRQLIAVYGAPDVVQLFDLTTGEELWRYAGRPVGGRRDPTPVAFSPDERTIAFFPFKDDKSGEIVLLDAATGSERTRLDTGEAYVDGLTFSPEGSSLAAWGHFGRNDGKSRPALWVWDTKSAQVRLRFVDTQMPKVAAFTPDGKTVALGYRAGGIAILDVLTSHYRWLVNVGEAKEASVGLNFSPDGKRLAATTKRGEITILDVASGRVLHRCDGPGAAGLGPRFLPNGDVVAQGWRDRAFVRWNVPSGEITGPDWKPADTVCSLAFKPGSRELIAASKDGAVSRWEIPDGRRLEYRAAPFDPEERIEGRVFMRYVLSPDGRFRFTNMHSAKREERMAWVEEVASGTKWVETTVENTLPHGDFSADGTLLAASWMFAHPNSFEIWDLITRRRVARLEPPHPGSLFSVAFHPDGKHLAASLSCRGNGEDAGNMGVYLCETGTGQAIRRLVKTGNAPWHLLYSPDGRLLAGEFEDRIVLWNSQTGREVWRYEVAFAAPPLLGPMAFSPDGRSLAVGVADLKDGRAPELHLGLNDPRVRPRVALLEAATGKVRREFVGHEADITAVAFSADGRLLATGSADTTIFVWDITK